jgi:protein-disulfide isomerase
MSEIPIPGTPIDLPVAAVGLAFYALFLLVLWRRVGDRDSESPRGRIQLGMALLSVAYSAVLFGYSISKQSICPFCAVLYVVNAGLLALSWRERGSSIVGFVRSGPRTLFSRSGLATAATMVGLTALAYFGYRGVVSASSAAAREHMAHATAPAPSGRPQKGPTNARFQFSELADFQCPHCKTAYHELEAFAASRSDVSITFLHFPLDQACNRLVTQPFHAEACERAVFAECANRQGLFFEAAPLLFEKGPLDLDAVSTQLGAAVGAKFDQAAMSSCRESAEARAAVVQDIEKGIEAGVQGTPTVFLNGVKIGGSLPRAELERLISELSKSPN